MDSEGEDSRRDRGPRLALGNSRHRHHRKALSVVRRARIRTLDADSGSAPGAWFHGDADRSRSNGRGSDHADCAHSRSAGDGSRSQVQHAVLRAAAIVFGHVGVETFESELDNADVRRLMTRVSMRVDRTLGTDAPALTQARIRVYLRDGSVLSRAADGARGYPSVRRARPTWRRSSCPVRPAPFPRSRRSVRSRRCARSRTLADMGGDQLVAVGRVRDGAWPRFQTMNVRVNSMTVAPS